MTFAEFIFAVQDAVNADPTRTVSKKVLELLRESGWSTTRDVPPGMYHRFLTILNNVHFELQAVS